MENNLAKLGNVFLIEVDKIKPNPYQPRTEFNEEQLNDLTESIRRYGVLQPLVVTRRETESPYGVSVEYELIAGERRLRAARMAGLSQIPVVIRQEDDEKIKLELAIIENLQREDLNAIERARAFKKLVEDFRLKHHEVAARVGKSREYVSNSIRLLALPSEVQDGLMRGDIGEGHCRTILTLDGRFDDQMRLYREIIDKRMNARQAERISKIIADGELEDGLREVEDVLPNQEITSIERKLSDKLGTRVQIEMRGNKGKLLINFSSSDDLTTFIDKMMEEESMASESPLETAFQQQAQE